MNHLYVKVDEADIHEMFAFADKDKDGRISYRNISLFSIIYIIYVFLGWKQNKISGILR